MSKFPKRVTREFTSEINDEQALEKYKELVEVDKTIDQVSAQKSASMADYNQELKGQRKRRADLLNIIETKIETRSVVCEERINEERQEIEVVRLDTGKVVEELTRPMTADERQLDLDDVAETNNDDDFSDLDDSEDDESGEDDEAAE